MSILKKPLITEKFTAISEKLNKYGFVVAKTASKVEIKKAVESMYSVNVTNINTMVYQGKNKSRFTKRGFFSGRKPSYKKAVVTLAEGQKIDFFQNI
ncbi:MAG: 50S ribosomal protein L23 [Bacteroidetes bacterium]|nr:50S ribosomal protein L23 [Bacteroidota bacterium]MCK6610234.1 50S ribosomal protein L23 [Bacteroidia bacterium]